MGRTIGMGLVVILVSVAAALLMVWIVSSLLGLELEPGIVGGAAGGAAGAVAFSMMRKRKANPTDKS